MLILAALMFIKINYKIGFNSIWRLFQTDVFWSGFCIPIKRKINGNAYPSRN